MGDVVGKIEPKLYRVILGNQFFFDFEGMPQTTTKKWGDFHVKGIEGQLMKMPNSPPSFCFIPIERIVAWIEVKAEDVFVPPILSPHGGTAR